MTRVLRRALVRARTWLRTALRGLASSPLPSTLTVLTIAVTLVLGGAFALLVANMQGLLDRVGRQVGVTAYLAADLSEEEVAALVARSVELPGVDSVEHVSREQAAERFAAAGGDRSGWLEALGDSPLPASIEIRLAPGQRTGSDARALAEALRTEPGVEDVTSDDDWVDGYVRTLALLRQVGWALGGVLAGATLILVASTIRLAIYARRDEIEILSLVGASRTFIALPFLLEGTLVGAVGGVVALVALVAGARALESSLGDGLAFLLGTASPVFFSSGEAVLLVGAGAILGLAGAAASLLGGTRT